MSVFKLQEVKKIKDILDNYDLTKVDTYCFFDVFKNPISSVHNLCNFLHEHEYKSSNIKYNYEDIILELIDLTECISVKCILYEKLHNIDSYLESYIRLIPASIRELLVSIKETSDYRPVNRIVYLFKQYIKYVYVKKIKLLKKSVIDQLKKLNDNSNRYYARVLIEVITLSQNMKITSSTDFQYCDSLLDQVKNVKAKDMFEFNEYEKLFEFMISSNKPKKKYCLDLAKYIYNNLEIMHDMQKQDKLYKACDYAEKFSDDEELKNMYKLEYSRISKKVLDSMEMRRIPLGLEEEELMQQEQEKRDMYFEKLSNLQQLLEVFFNITIISEKDLDKQADIMSNESFIFDFIPTSPIDPKTGMLVKSDDSKKLVLRNTAFNIHLQIAVFPIFISFVRKFSVDDEVESFIGAMLRDNMICRPTKIISVKTSIIGILKKDYSIHLRNLVADFEDGLKYFFENNNLSTIQYERGHQSRIDMNDIFRVDEKNIFRNKLLEYMNDDMVFILMYLGVSSTGYNLRNKLMHGEIDDEEYSTGSVLYFSFLIIQTYFGFYCNR